MIGAFLVLVLLSPGVAGGNAVLSAKEAKAMDVLPGWRPVPAPDGLEIVASSIDGKPNPMEMHASATLLPESHGIQRIPEAWGKPQRAVAGFRAGYWWEQIDPNTSEPTGLFMIVHPGPIVNVSYMVTMTYTGGKYLRIGRGQSDASAAAIRLAKIVNGP